MAHDAPARLTVSRGQAALAAVIGILYWTAHTMIRPLVGPEVIAQGGSANLASITLAAFAVLPTLVAIPIGSFTDRIGSRSMLIQGTALMVVGGVVLSTPTGMPGLLTSQVLIGVGTLMAWVSLQATITSVTDDDTPDRRNSRLATFSLYLAAGQAIGPFLGGFIADTSGRRSAFVTFTAISIVLLAMGWRSVGSTRRSANDAGIWRETGRSFPAATRLMRRPTLAAAVIVSFGALVALDLRNAFLPLLLDPLGYDPFEIGIILSASAVAAFASRPFFPMVMRHLTPAWTVAAVLGISAVSSMTFVWAETMPLLITVSLVNGFALGFAQPLTLSMMAGHTSPGERGLGSGLRSMANRAAQFANPAAMAGATAVGGVTLGFVAIGGGLLVTATWCAWTLRDRPPEPVGEAPPDLGG